MASRHVYRIVVHKKCDKAIKEAPKDIQNKVDKAFLQIAQEPHHGVNIKQMEGAYKEYHRYRVGNYRLIYKIDDEEVKVLALKFGSRGDVYK